MEPKKATGVTAGDIGEFALIERLRARLPAHADDRLIVGIGDDAAVWRGGAFSVATTDTMVAGVHFLPGVVGWRDVGWKALAVNISDIGAMGATPSYALVTLMVPPETKLADLDALYDGLAECAKEYSVAIAGGDIVRAPVFAITVALYGEASVDEHGAPLLVRRDAARPGDVVAVSGSLGGSAAGLRVLRDRALSAADEATAELIREHVRPTRDFGLGPKAASAGIRCGIDISDGLVQDLGHVCRASGVDAELDASAIPVHPRAIEVFGEQDALMLALTGGEDYQLLVVGPEDRVQRTQSFYVIGRITGAGEGRVRVLGAGGREIKIDAGGFDHLRGSA